MLGLTEEEKQRALTYASGGADFMFIPSSELCNLIIKGSPETVNINSVLISILLNRKPIRLDVATVIKYCKDKLDNKNTWLLNHGDIKIVPHKYKESEFIKLKE